MSLASLVEIRRRQQQQQQQRTVCSYADRDLSDVLSNDKSLHEELHIKRAVR